MNDQIDESMTGRNEPLLIYRLRLQALVMSLIILFLFVCALAALSRLPEFITFRAAGWQLRVIGTVLFNLLVVAGIVDNVYSHRAITRMQQKDESD